MTAGAWVLLQTGKWHAWPHGGTKTLCHRVHAAQLQEKPARRITASAPDASEDVCRVCQKKAGVVPEALGGLLDSPHAAAWAGFLRRHLRQAHITVAARAQEELAQRLAEVGGPEDPAAREVFEQVRTLLLRPMRRTNGSRGFRTVPRLREALDQLPPKAGALRQVAAAMRTWRAVTSRDPAADNFRPDQVVATMLKLPNAEPYIRHLHEKDLSHLALVFHPNTLERAKRDTALRGLFAGSSEYWNDTIDQLNIVTD